MTVVKPSDAAYDELVRISKTKQPMTSEILNTAVRAVSQLATNGERVKALIAKTTDDFALGKDEASNDDAAAESDGEEKVLEDVENDNDDDGAADQMPIDNDSDGEGEFKETKETKKVRKRAVARRSSLTRCLRSARRRAVNRMA